MPSQAMISIPVLSNATLATPSISHKSKAPVVATIERRYYNDEPLPVKPSDHAPRDARIVKRDITAAGLAVYELAIGNTSLRDVGLDELLEYVSAYELEEFENKQFEEEREVLRVVEEQQAEEERELHERRKERAKMKGVAEVREMESDDDESESNQTQDALGGRGRARPSYTHMFLKPRERKRRRRRDPVTNKLIPLSDGDNGMLPVRVMSEEPSRSSSGPAMQLQKLLRRRRRKRDPVTGILLPLSDQSDDEDFVTRQADSLNYYENEVSENPNPMVLERRKRDTTTQEPVQPGLPQKPKRRRRRRHPLTGELMPYGWRYNPEEEQGPTERDEHEMRLLKPEGDIVKRPRLDASSSSSQRSLSPAAMLQRFTKPTGIQQAQSMSKQNTTAHQHHSLNGSSDADSTDRQDLSTSFKPRPQPIRRSTGGAHVTAAVPVSPSKNEARTPERMFAPLQASSSQRTSITHPSALVPPTAAAVDEPEESDEDLGDDEWFVEAILAHGYSDPKTHPTLASRPVMLYKVKWEGYDDPTWEPLGSFSDMDTVREYQRKTGMTWEECEA